MSPDLLHVADAIVYASEHPPAFCKVLPLELENGTNQRGKWARHADATRRKRAAVALTCRSLRQETGRLVVLITRIGPRALDSDGAVASAKPVRDGIADALGIDDRDPRVTWLVDQERGGVREYGCRIEVWRWTP